MKSTTRFVLLSAIVLALGGCAQKLTYERFQTICPGDPPEAVQAILGKPWMKSVNGQAWAYQDTDRGINAMIYFQDGRVTSKKWGDPVHGIQGDPAVTAPGESKETHIQEIK